MGASKFTAKEWDASGAIHCYGVMDLRSFVVEVCTAEPVRGDILQKAVDKALERLSYYRQTLVRKGSLFYYADNDLPFVVAESAEPRRVGGATTNYHMVDVVYHDATISFSMHHGFCDGLGLNRFIEAVLYHYFCMKDGKAYSDEGIYTDNVPFDPAETVDAFEEKTDADVNELRALAGGAPRYRVPELDEPDGKGPTMHRLPLKIKADDLLAWCKANSSSPAATISAFMARAVARENDVREGVIMSVAPISLRAFLGADKTFKNCSAAAFMPIDAADAREKPVGELAAAARQKLKTQMGEGTGRLLSVSINMITHMGKKVPTFFLKTKILSMPQTRPQDTFYMDYVGSLTTNDYADQITDVHYLNADPCGGSFFVLTSATAGYFHVSLSQTFASDRYYKALCAVLDEQGLPYEQLPRETYLNPVVEQPVRVR